MPGLSKAAAVPDLEPLHPHAPGAEPGVETDRPRVRANRLQWGFALAVLAILAVCMVAALNALSNL
jgi:hypothetical protein